MEQTYARHIVVVEDEALLRDLIARSLESEGFLVTTAANANDAKRAVFAVDPDALVLDVELGPGPNGFDLLDSLQPTHAEIPAVFLTDLPDPRFAGRTELGFGDNIAYLSKQKLVDSKELVLAIESAMRGKGELRFRHDLHEDRPLRKLSPRQMSVLHLVAQGMTNSQIAELRGTSIRAVEGIISRIFIALGIDVKSDSNARVEAATMYLRATGKVLAERK